MFGLISKGIRDSSRSIIGSKLCQGTSLNISAKSLSAADKSTLLTTKLQQIGRMFSSSTDGTTAYHIGSSTNIKWHEGSVSRDDKESMLNQRGCVLWFTGLSGSGKSTLAYTLEHALAAEGKLGVVLDGDNIRHGLNKNLGFSTEDREENIRRIGEVSKLFASQGLITLVSFISPYRRDRDAVRSTLPAGDFIEIYMKIPVAVCEERDPKGLYKAARAGKIKGFTGIDDPYEEPTHAEIVMEVSKEDGVLMPPETMALNVLRYLQENNYLGKAI
mmetsp:Transcript_29669/g.40973  ORF Transcript_29669/g.40973 Transcript_29669/m.40973 type:complete len:274 (-) Transcript_29669:211-1032(-)|eukprot:CAMPEP_0196579696 /NCGR_PEP_ID=MMETSP1081-20130531/24458_1 /TAXON_ID=36882 /ORGANISM="Pyramimonas amylifera, Strain CCMP720" /LENGTH=273 /DNA_ID=CAMNT_0041899353 /DNA_START=93 /DNA_END=914 /DNA_ORIENTATION=+